MEKEYVLEVGSGNLAEIERAVEAFKRRALPEIEEELLTAVQAKFVMDQKKGI